MDKIEQQALKESIAEKYIEKFKKELWWLKALAISPIEKKLKNIMTSEEELWWKSIKDLDNLWRWGNILWFLTPKMSIDIFDFLKEKQSLLIQSETEWNLDELMQEVITWKKPELDEKDDNEDLENEGNTENQDE